MATSPPPSLSEKSAAIYAETIIAAILATAAIGVASPTPDNLIAKYKEMLQKLRAKGDPFN
jgi:hypothetical protein